MEDQKYVIAIALAEQNNKRLMPLGGKTFSAVDTLSQSSKKEVEKIILDLLLRLFQRSTEGSLKISNDEIGLLLAEISFESMHNNIPVIKSNWINSGDTDILIEQLKSICSNLWSIQFKKHEGILFNNLKNKD
ncbi:hypothetical protein [Prochlorococcus marinus]|uniref:hypothetical protein n=1 Tax=Prochlorococcus marinus TaxID=1219 RepID=UPI0022B4604F|nr:hypothetical protein [Prochlorococcus marinus]